MGLERRALEGHPFIWGSAISAYQCEGAWNEGGKGLGEWDYFCARSPQNAGRSDGTVASDFYHRFEEDIELAARGGQNSIRLSLSWSRILPKGRGEANEEGLRFYDRVIDFCLEKGVEPNLTLFQYDLPYSLALEGGWSNVAVAQAFCSYARLCFERFGDRVRLWSTVDEPQYYSYCSNVLGIYPPGRRSDLQSYLQWQYNQMLGSALAVSEFRKVCPSGLISVIHQDSNVEVAPQTRSPKEVAAAADFFYNRMVLCPALEGRLPPELDEMASKMGTYLYRAGGDEELFAAGRVDFLSLNVYCRKYVTDWSGGKTGATTNSDGTGGPVVESQVIAPLFETTVDQSVERNKWGREILPRVTYSSIMRVKEQYGNPDVIVENGFGAHEAPQLNGEVEDDDRIAFLEQTVDNLKRAREKGANVRGYYYWSTMDLYSWINGYEKRYGLVRVDFDEGLKRHPKKSWRWFGNLIRSTCLE